MPPRFANLRVMFTDSPFTIPQTAAQLSTGINALVNFVVLFGLTVDAFLIYTILTRLFGRAPLLSAPRVELPKWSVTDALMIFLSAFLTVGVISIIVFFASSAMGYEEDQSKQLTMLTANSAKPVVEIVFIAVLLWVRGARFVDVFGTIPHPTLRAFGIGLLVFVAVIPPVMFLNLIYIRLSPLFKLPLEPQETIKMLRTEPNESLVVWLMVFAVVVAPIVEEIVFRGFIYPAVKKKLGLTAAVLAVSAGFALVHFSVPAFAPLFLLGAVLTLAFEATGSLWTPIVIHMSFNSFFTFLALQTRQ